MWSCKSQQLFSSIKVLNLTIAAALPNTHGGLGQVLTVLLLVQIRLCLRRDSGEYFPHPRLVPCELHNVEAPAEAGFRVDGKGGHEGLVG